MVARSFLSKYPSLQGVSNTIFPLIEIVVQGPAANPIFSSSSVIVHSPTGYLRSSSASPVLSIDLQLILGVPQVGDRLQVVPGPGLGPSPKPAFRHRGLAEIVTVLDIPSSEVQRFRPFSPDGLFGSQHRTSSAAEGQDRCWLFVPASACLLHVSPVPFQVCYR